MIFSAIHISLLANPNSEIQLKKSGLKATKIAWTPIQNARGYVLQIANETGKREEYKSTTDQIDLYLEPGYYSHRVGTLNKFNKVSSWSEWKPLTILVSTDPVIDEVAPRTIARSKNIRITLSGKNLDASTKIQLRSGNRNLKILSTTYKGEKKIILEIDSTSAAGGTYTVLLTRSNSKPRPSNISIVLDENPSRNKSFSWRLPDMNMSLLVPGMRQKQRGETYKSKIIVSSMSFLGVLYLKNYYEGSQYYEKGINDPAFLFNNPAIIYSIQNSSVPREGLGPLALSAFLQYDSNAEKLTKSKQNLRLMGIGLASIYLFHLYDTQASIRIPISSSSNKQDLEFAMTSQF